jgi:hypothetical protein
VSKYLATPTFALQSVVDHDQIGSGKGGRCCSDCSTPASVNAFAQRLHAALETGLFSGALANHHGGFIDSCVHHCGSWAGNASAHVLVRNSAFLMETTTICQDGLGTTSMKTDSTWSVFAGCRDQWQQGGGGFQAVVRGCSAAGARETLGAAGTDRGRAHVRGLLPPARAV